MSRVYFHSRHGQAELHGSERAYLGGLCNDIAIGLFHLDGSFYLDRIKELITPGHYMTATPNMNHARWVQQMGTALRVGDEPVLSWKGQPIGSWELILNTAAAVGNDQIKLAARLHGQCEIHAYVEGPHRAWLADIMQTGLDCGIYRHQHPGNPEFSQGWAEVIALLRSRDDEPVVTSYSVCDQFPNSNGWVAPPLPADWVPSWATSEEGLAEWAEVEEDSKASERHEAEREQWWDLSDDERWSIALTELRANVGGLELTPDNWAGFRFYHQLTVFDLHAPDYAARLDAALLPAEVSDGA